MVQPGGYRTQAFASQERHRSLGPLGCGDVDVLRLGPRIEQGVTHATTDESRRLSVARKRVHDRSGELVPQPARRHSDGHGGFTSPGTIRPSSMREGT